MDIKVSGLTREILRDALNQAKQARAVVLDKMLATISKPRAELSKYAPRITTIHINPERIKDVIGPSGKVIKSIIENTGVRIEVEDSGRILIASPDVEANQRAVDMIRRLTEEAEIGKIYTGKVRKIVDFGAFVEILPGIDGLVHISQLAEGRVNRVEDVVREGDEIKVKVLDIDRQGKIRLSRKDALEAEGQKDNDDRGYP